LDPLIFNIVLVGKPWEKHRKIRWFIWIHHI
jgi:hypothetical protein